MSSLRTMKKESLLRTGREKPLKNRHNHRATFSEETTEPPACDASSSRGTSKSAGATTDAAAAAVVPVASSPSSSSSSSISIGGLRLPPPPSPSQTSGVGPGASLRRRTECDSSILSAQASHVGSLPSLAMFNSSPSLPPFFFSSGASWNANDSSWDRSVAVIDSVIDPEGKAYEGLSTEQRDGLSDLRRMLLEGSSGKKARQRHVPEELLRTIKTSDVAAHLSAEFGGVQISKPSPAGRPSPKDMVRRSVRDVARASTVIRNFHLSVSERDVGLRAHRPPEWIELGRENRRRVAELLSWKNVSRWDFNVLELDFFTNGKPLFFVGWAILASPYSQRAMASSWDHGGDLPEEEGYDFVQEFDVPEETLCEFLRTMESDYRRSNPYHNNVHAADVVQTLHALLRMDDGRHVASSVDAYAILLAAVIHDVDHPGRNNNFQINARTDLALLYNDVAVLENMHAARAFRRLLGEEMEEKMNVLRGLSSSQLSSVRKVMIKAVLHTDMAMHFADAATLKGLIASRKKPSSSSSSTSIGNQGEAAHDNKSSMTNTEAEDRESTLKVMCFLLHLADISNPAKPSPMFIKWADRCLSEFFAQGDREAEMGLTVSPLCDRTTTSRPASQIGFINFVVKPSYELLERLIPEVGKVIVPVIEANLDYWKKREADGLD